MVARIHKNLTPAGRPGGGGGPANASRVLVQIAGAGVGPGDRLEARAARGEPNVAGGRDVDLDDVDAPVRNTHDQNGLAVLDPELDARAERDLLEAVLRAPSRSRHPARRWP